MTNEGMELTPELERVQAAVRALGEVRADAGFREGLKQDFVSGAIARRSIRGTEAPERAAPRTEPEVGPRSNILRWLGWSLVPLAAAAALLFVLLGPGPGWSFHSVTGQGLIAVNGEPVDAGDTARLASLLGPGARVALPGGVTLDLIAGDVLLLELAEGAEATIPENPGRRRGRLLESRLSRGELRFKTGPEFTGRRYEVSTAEGLIEVTGTVVSVLKAEDNTCVCVLEGAARIGRDEARMDDVSAGWRKVMFSDDRPSEITEIKPMHQQGLEDFLGRNEGVFR